MNENDIAILRALCQKMLAAVETEQGRQRLAAEGIDPAAARRDLEVCLELLDHVENLIPRYLRALKDFADWWERNRAHLEDVLRPRL